MSQTPRAKLSNTTQRAVWARSGGICAWPGCKAILYQDPVFFTTRVFGELAHNVAASAQGPRGHKTRSSQLGDDPDNLILFCPTHHELVDKPGWEVDYPETLLASWKKNHEDTIRIAGQNSHGRRAHGLRYLGVIGGQPIAADPGTIPHAALQRGIVLTKSPFDLRLDASGYPPRTREYWNHVISEIRKQIANIQAREEGQLPIALFAVADMPALMAIGFALGHSAEIYPFQWDRFAHSWKFPNNAAPACVFHEEWPQDDHLRTRPVAIVMSLSGVITMDRIHAALPGQDPAILHIVADQPRLDLVQSAATIDAFRLTLAGVLSRLEGIIPKTEMLHIFPAMPAPLAVALGMAVKPKVSFPIQIYDADGPNGPFGRALVLPQDLSLIQ